jgi:hypothetical protein
MSDSGKIEVGDYVEVVLGDSAEYPKGFLGKVFDVDTTGGTLGVIDARGDYSNHCHPAVFRPVTLDELYADEEAYHEMREEADEYNTWIGWRVAVPIRPGSYSMPEYDEPTSQPPSAGSILREAADIVDGQRNKTHGARERSFQAIADFWNVYLEHSPRRPVLSSIDVAQMMVLLKIARSLTGEPIADHFVDAAGYSGVAGELAARGL